MEVVKVKTEPTTLDEEDAEDGDDDDYTIESDS